MEELDLKELFLIFWNKKFEIILITLIAMLIGVVYSYFYVVPVYKSSTKLVLAQSSTQQTEVNADGAITQADVTLNSKLVSTYSEIIKSKSVLREVVNSLNINGVTEGGVKGSTSVQAIKDTEVIQITVQNLDPNIAAQIANKIAEVFSEKVVEIYNISNVYILDRAEPSSSPSNINHSKDIIIFAFIGLVISVGFVLVLNMLDTTIKTEQDVETATGLLVLISIPNYDVEQKKKERSRK